MVKPSTYGVLRCVRSRSDLVSLGLSRSGRLTVTASNAPAAGTRFPEGFLADVRADQKPFCWVNRHIGSLLDTGEAQLRSSEAKNGGAALGREGEL